MFLDGVRAPGLGFCPCCVAAAGFIPMSNAVEPGSASGLGHIALSPPASPGQLRGALLGVPLPLGIARSELSVFHRCVGMQCSPNRCLVFGHPLALPGLPAASSAIRATSPLQLFPSEGQSPALGTPSDTQSPAALGVPLLPEHLCCHAGVGTAHGGVTGQRAGLLGARRCLSRVSPVPQVQTWPCSACCAGSASRRRAPCSSTWRCTPGCAATSAASATAPSPATPRSRGTCAPTQVRPHHLGGSGLGQPRHDPSPGLKQN